MLVRLEKINKYFNKRKKNEIHVINNTSLEMDEKGMVALLGPSGCGKTTLLNAIGGLDKVNNGHIYINGERITHRRSGAVDKIRTLNVGYIFQNYNLVENMSVFDNVALALKMTGVKDQKIIKEKVDYVLEQVGMYRYRNRYANMLSGGERQRVGIARAIVKNPAIIIADEPTGNLDSRNTIEIMNIIRSISQNRLVILVTHEEELAKFYASRIIRIKDGTIESDEQNIHDNNLNYRMENQIYLKDIKEHKRLKNGYFDIDFYNDEQIPISLDIAVRNGNIYIQSKGKNARIELVDEQSSIELIDSHYKELTKEDSLDNGFDAEKLEYHGKRKYTSIINPLRMVINGFKSVFGYPILKKILLIGFLVSAMFITYAMGNIFGVLNITDDEFVKADRSYLTIVSKNVKVKQYKKYEKDDRFQYVMPGDSIINLSISNDDYLQLRPFSASLTGSLSDSGKLSNSDLVSGRLPENKQEIVVDQMILDTTISESYTKQAGLADASDFLEQEVQINNLDPFTIVGITDFQSPCIYADQDRFIDLIYNSSEIEGDMYESDSGSDKTLMDYQWKKSDVTLKKGTWPQKAYEVIVNESNKEEMPLNKEIDTTVNGQKLKVVGYYTDKSNSDYMLVNGTTIKYQLITSSSNITACPENKDETLAELQSEGVNIKDTYQTSKDEYVKELWSYVRSSLILAAVVLAISFIEIFLIMRASFLSRVKEVGVYRAIGVRKRDIYKMFIGEIFAITTIASMPGFLFMAYIIHKVSSIPAFADMFLVTPSMLILCIILLYGFNLLFGLLPVFRTMRKRPAAILSRTDIN